jgi:Ca2+:H+ antiporter
MQFGCSSLFFLPSTAQLDASKIIMYRQASRSRSPTERDPLLGGSQCDSASQRRDRDWKSGASHAIKQIPATLARTNANVLLLFVPLGIAAGALHWESSVVFALNFMAILPLAGLLSFATEELAATLGPTLGGLVNATCGNAVELIVRLRFLAWGWANRSCNRSALSL